jgi:hypothetical protein
MRVFLLLILTSCGYSIRRTDVNIDRTVEKERSEHQRVFVPVVDNLTQRTGIEQILTSSVREVLSTIQSVDVVTRAEDADFFLWVTIVDYSTSHGPTPIRGTTSTAEAGGLAEGQSLAADIVVKLGVNAKLQRKPEVSGAHATLKPLIWDRYFERSATLEASQRFADLEGSSSAPFINASREKVQIKLLSDGLAQNILDQLIENF